MGNRSKTSLKNDQQGIVSILLTVFVLIVLSLVVLAFSQNTRREQRQALDRQLSTQAYYAAESGINQTIDKIRRGELTQLKSDKCSNNTAESLDSNTGTGGQNAFTLQCVLYDRAPAVLRYSNVDTTKGEFFSMKTVANDLNHIKISWTRSEGGNGNYSGCSSVSSVASLPANAGDPTVTNCSAGLLRVMLIPAAFNNPNSRENLYNQSQTIFLRPTRNASDATAQVPYEPHSVGADSQGKIIPAKCSSNGRCEVTVLGLPSGTNVYMQVRSIYYSNAVDVYGYNVTNNPVNFDDAQAEVDVTGKASDVLRRVQIRMPLYEDYVAPANVLDVMNGLCKRLGVYPTVPELSAGGGVAGYANNDECGGLGL